MAEDKVWAKFAQVVKGYVPSQQEITDQKWREMAKQSSQQRLMLQKQNNLRARMRAL